MHLRNLQSMLVRATIALCLPALTVALHAQQIRDVQVPRVKVRPRLEEFLNGASRPEMRHIDDFRQRQPGDGEPAIRKTEAWVGYDDQNFYAVFVCETHGDTRARMAKREDIFADDVVGVILDTYHDHQRAYEFFVNPFGVQADGITMEGQNDDMSFDTLWYSEGRLTSNGFAALITIPFRSLRFPPTGPQTWGLALMRIVPVTNENDFWPYITNRVAGFAQQMGNAQGLENISPGRNLQIIPYAAFSGSHFLDNPTNGIPAFRTKNDLRVGLDAKAVLHDTLSLDIAVNPDFSQVESDDPQVTVNQRFEVQFPEKRPFFLENAGYFITPENLFFSRRVVDPEFGARLTGKIGRWDLGVLAMDDRAAGTALDANDPHFGDRAEVGVLRVQREFAKQSSVGVLFTDREFAGGYNRVAAVDTRLRLDENWTFSGQAMSSQTLAEDGTRSGGDAFNFDLHRQSRNYSFDWQYIDRAEGFHTDLGFVNRVNIREAQQYIERRIHPKKPKKILSYGANLFSMLLWDHAGVQQEWHTNPGFFIEMPRTTIVNIGYGQAFERFGGINFRHSGTNVAAHTEYWKRATLDFNYGWSTGINYDPAATLAPFLGNQRNAQVNLTFRPVGRLKIEEIYYYTNLRLPASSVFVNHLARSRVNYQFTRALSLRWIVDYNGVLSNPALVNIPRQKRVTGDVLLTYLLHPGTAVYVGYTDRLENLSLLPGITPVVSAIGFPSTTTARQFFAKVSYLFRF